MAAKNKTRKEFAKSNEYRLKAIKEIASEVAHAMKKLAIDRGATHFTHWFQPLTGSTAEKHNQQANLSHSLYREK